MNAESYYFSHLYTCIAQIAGLGMYMYERHAHHTGICSLITDLDQVVMMSPSIPQSTHLLVKKMLLYAQLSFVPFPSSRFIKPAYHPCLNATHARSDAHIFQCLHYLTHPKCHVHKVYCVIWAVLPVRAASLYAGW